MSAEETLIPETISDSLYDDDDVIVIKKSWLVLAGASLASLVIGGLIGYGLAIFAFNQGVNSAASIVQQPGLPAAQVQPTQPPARLDNVSADDDPSLGSPDAKVVIVEFSDFR